MLRNFYSIILLCIFNLWAKLKKSTATSPPPTIPIPFHELEEKERKREKKREENKKVTSAIEINSHFREIFLEKYADINININLIIIRVRLLEFHFSI